MKWFQGFIEKCMVSVLVAGLFYLAKQSLGFFVSLPELYLYVGSKVLLGPPYFFVLVFTVGIYLVFSTIISGFIIWNHNLGQVCKQFRFLSQVSYFASNGVASYRFIRKGQVPCIEICLQNFSFNFTSDPAFTTSADCGIIFSKSLGRWPLTKGFLISNKEKMCFEIMGKEGGEQIGVALKNTYGHEQKLSLSKFLEGGIGKSVWKIAKINLEEYARVTRSTYEKAHLGNFSIFTNSNLSGDKKQVVYIRNIEFI